MVDVTALARQLYAHAETTADYNGNGWDVVVECFTIDEIAERLTEDKVTTLKGAIKSFKTSVDVWADRQADAVNSAF